MTRTRSNQRRRRLEVLLRQAVRLQGFEGLTAVACAEKLIVRRHWPGLRSIMIALTSSVCSDAHQPTLVLELHWFLGESGFAVRARHWRATPVRGQGIMRE
jgi:hypothetical protein